MSGEHSNSLSKLTGSRQWPGLKHVCFVNYSFQSMLISFMIYYNVYKKVAKIQNVNNYHCNVAMTKKKKAILSHGSTTFKTKTEGKT